jgi:ATP/maltotriose-dependent transcriptional regulator MalT
VDVLDARVPSPDLAAGYAIQSWLAMLRHEREKTVDKADRAIEVARRVGDVRVEAHALNNKGVAISDEDFPEGIDFIEESFTIARAHGLDQDAIRAAANLADAYREQRDLPDCERWLREAALLTEESASGRFELHVTGRRADLYLLKGEWDQAETLARAALGSGLYVAPDRPSPLTVLGLLAARRGDADPIPLLREAVEVSRDLDSLERLAPAVAAWAEAAFLQGDVGAIPSLVSDTFDEAMRRRYEWTAGELAYWLWRAGALQDPMQPMGEPYRLEIAGEWHQAAECWQALGLPYQEALALADGDVSAQVRALAIFDGLGATVTAGMVRKRLHDQGVRRVPRGPNKATRANAAGLTARHCEVLDLMARGYSNAEIAGRTFISSKTVEHHVSAILSKLGVTNRRDAVRAARERGLLTREASP